MCEKTTTTVPTRLLIESQGRQFFVCLDELTNFLAVSHTAGIETINDLGFEIQAIANMVVDCQTCTSVKQLQRSLILLRELDFLFKGLLYQEPIKY